MSRWRCTGFYNHVHRSWLTAKACWAAQHALLLNPLTVLLSKVVNSKVSGDYTLRKAHLALCHGLYLGALLGMLFGALLGTLAPTTLPLAAAFLAGVGTTAVVVTLRHLVAGAGGHR